ncbi:MAG TPA: VTT domain-containing protein [Caulobacteraceae bacterium]|nr:VTT domain-containing protein [Caulobacteraceae bacterium]
MSAAIRRYGLFALVAALFAAAMISGAWRHISLQELQANRTALTHFVAAHFALSLALYVGLYVLVVVACIPGPGALCAAGGFLFGAAFGGAASLIGGAAGAVIVSLACRTAFGDWAAERAGPRVRMMQQAFAGNAFSTIVTLRLVPVMPLFATNIAAGLARAPLPAVAGASLVGGAPVAFILAGLGAGLGVLFDHGAKVDAHLFEKPQVILPLAGLALLSLGPLAWRQWRRRRAANRASGA